MTYMVSVIAVSVDAYFAAIAYGLGEKLGVIKIAYAASFTFFVCMICGIAGEWLSSVFPIVGKAGGAIFIFLGAHNYLSYFEKKSLTINRKNGGAAALGLAVSADAGVSSLAFGGGSIATVAFYSLCACLAHFAFLLLGARCAELRFKAKTASVASGVALMAIGFFKTFF